MSDLENKQTDLKTVNDKQSNTSIAENNKEQLKKKKKKKKISPSDLFFYVLNYVFWYEIYWLSHRMCYF